MQALTPREVIADKSTKPYGIKTDLGWGIVDTTNVKSEKSLWNRVAVKEVPVVTMKDIIRVLESDFKENKGSKMTSQADLTTHAYVTNLITDY